MADYDVAVIGAGIAGLNAAITSARHGLTTVVIETLGAGGQIINVDRVENFPGPSEGLAGYELGPSLQMQADEAGVEFILDTVTGIDQADDGFVIIGSEASLSVRAVIVAVGSTRRKLGIPGEDVFEGKGVSHCASCDGPLLRSKDVCVIGGGDSALDEALTLSVHAQSVTIVHRMAEPTARYSLIEKCREAGNINFLASTEVKAIHGDSGVTHVQLETSAGLQDLSCHSVFIYVGLEPAGEFLGDLVARDEHGKIKVDLKMQTSQPGIFAAGDVRQDSVAHLSASAGDGVTAAISTVRHLGEQS